MSLCISLNGEIGYYRSQELVDYINNTLEEIGITGQGITTKSIANDVILPGIDTKTSEVSSLQFVAAKLNENPAWKPEIDFTRQRISSDAKEYYILENKSHLICQCAYSGYYVPVDFHDIPLPPGCLFGFGSSYNLCNELKALAAILNLDLGDYSPDLYLLLQQRYQELKNDRLFSEKMLILYLYNMCLGSIMHGLTIVFSG
jgi:hypothetical protein